MYLTKRKIAITKNKKKQGRVDLEYLPETLVSLDASGNAFSGTVNLEYLPTGLTTLNLQLCIFNTLFFVFTHKKQNTKK